MEDSFSIDVGVEGWFQGDSSTLHLLYTWLLVLLHELYLRSSGIRSRRLGDPWAIDVVSVFKWRNWGSEDIINSPTFLINFRNGQRGGFESKSTCLKNPYSQPLRYKLRSPALQADSLPTELLGKQGPSSQGYGFSSGHVWMGELDYKESWASKNWCFWTVVLEKTLESPLDCKEIQVHPKGDQSWVFIGRTDFETATPILWPPDVKSWLIWKDPDTRKDWGQEEKGTTEDEMIEWHHWLHGHVFG